MGAVTTDRLRDVPVFASLGAGELERLARLGRERRLAAGEFLFRQGDLARAFHVVLDGRLETTREVAGEELRRLAFSHPSLLGAFLPVLESVGHAVKGVERDREKLLAVGKLASGLAHELNNPAAAASRAVATLRAYERERLDALARLAGAGEERLAALAALGAEAGDQGTPRERLDPLAESDREQELLDLLEARAVADAHLVAASLTEAGLGAEWVDRTAAAVGEEAVSPALRFVAACAGAREVLAELDDATTRISDLVGAVRDYTYLDQGPSQTVDIHEALESTLALLAHKLRDKQVQVVRD